MIRIHFLSLPAMLMISVSAFLQCNHQLFHTSGAQQFNCVNIAVERSTQFADTSTSYCPSVTSPYLLGVNLNNLQSGTGNYIFHIEPPVTGVTLNFSGLTGDGFGNLEIASLYVNGTHYAIPAQGTPNGCDPMAILTADGDIAGNGDVSGWLGTTITGSISTLEVRDSLISGSPGGMLFSLFFCEPDYDIDIGSDTTLCIGDTLILVPSLPPIMWHDGSQVPFFKVTSPGIYWAGSSFNGCLATDSVEITYKPCGNSVYALEMPNVFTPNGDGLNDLFVPIFEQGLLNAHLTILNRWGNTIFTGTLQGGWNGLASETACTEGIYFYSVDYQVADGSEHIVYGFTELLR